MFFTSKHTLLFTVGSHNVGREQRCSPCCAAQPSSGLLAVVWLIGVYAILYGITYIVTYFQTCELQASVA
jgi:Short repeat of unknown function (DUF308)